MKKIFTAATICMVMASTSAFAVGAGAISGAFAGADNAGNSQNITFTSPPYTETHVSGTQTLKTVPQVYAPSIGVSAPCQTALSGGVSVVGFGVSAGGSVEDKGCTMRETSRLLHGIGQPAAAARVMCNDEMAAKALGSAICAGMTAPVAGEVAPVSAAPASAPVATAPAATAPVAVVASKTPDCKEVFSTTLGRNLTVCN